MQRTSVVDGAEFFQLGYVTGNLDAAMALWRSRYAVPGFFEFSPRDFPAPEGMAVPMRVAIGYQGSVMIELIEPDPADAGLYKGALRSDGGTMLHHLGYLVDEGTFANYPKQIAELGIPMPYVHDSDELKVLYADTREDGGLFTEIVGRSAAVLGMFANIPRLSVAA